MDADKVSANISARVAAQKKEIESQRTQIEEDRKERIDKQTAADLREKHQEDLVQISKQGTQQLDAARKEYVGRVQDLKGYNEKNYQLEAERTANEIKNVQGQWAKEIHDIQGKSLENIHYVASQKQDPFYQLKSMNPSLVETDKEYAVSVALPEHEARNVVAGTDGGLLTLSLARRYQDSYRDTENNRMTKTNSYQTLVDQVPIPGPIEKGKVIREFKDGLLTFRIPKQVFTGKI